MWTFPSQHRTKNVQLNKYVCDLAKPLLQYKLMKIKRNCIQNECDNEVWLAVSATNSDGNITYDYGSIYLWIITVSSIGIVCTPTLERFLFTCLVTSEVTKICFYLSFCFILLSFLSSQSLFYLFLYLVTPLLAHFDSSRALLGQCWSFDKQYLELRCGHQLLAT